jgi:signal peptidase I
MKKPAFLDPDAPFDRPVAPVGDDGLTDAQRRANRVARFMLVPLIVVLVAFVLVFFVFYDFARVDGASMNPTLLNNEHVLITRGLAQPKRGDVVVLDVIDRGEPAEWVKRIVALGGDRVSVHGNQVLVNGAPETFEHAILDNGSSFPTEEITVPAGTVFVLGDNRSVSLDSRFVGSFKATDIHGKVIAVYSPVTRIRLIPGP